MLVYVFKIESRVRRNPVTHLTLPELEQALVEEWRNITQRFILNYVFSMRQRCVHIVRAMGGHTRYKPLGCVIHSDFSHS